MQETIKSTHDDLIDQYDYDEAWKARAESLSVLQWDALQDLAAEAGVYERGGSKTSLRRALGKAGYYYGEITDRRVYRYDADADETEVVSDDY